MPIHLFSFRYESYFSQIYRNICSKNLGYLFISIFSIHPVIDNLKKCQSENIKKVTEIRADHAQGTREMDGMIDDYAATLNKGIDMVR